MGQLFSRNWLITILVTVGIVVGVTACGDDDDGEDYQPRCTEICNYLSDCHYLDTPVTECIDICVDGVTSPEDTEPEDVWVCIYDVVDTDASCDNASIDIVECGAPDPAE